MGKPNILLITADDLNWNSVGAYGCETPSCTPHIDALAASGLRFNHAHVTIAVCQPSRGALMTGRYPHRSRLEGFHHINGSDLPLLTEELRRAGYLCGILGKADHSSPKEAFRWDYWQDMPELAWGRDPDLYHAYTCEFLARSCETGQPFFLMANSHDPHRPFHGNDGHLNGRDGITYPPPSRVYAPEEVEVPGFLPDLPEVRQEIAEYASSVRRCDDTVGRVLEALDQAGCRDNTLAIFLSDNGMAFPFSKTNCYLHSTKTPWIVSWPGHVDSGTVDDEHLINGIDLMPTILEAIDAPLPEGLDGASFLPVLHGQTQSGREQVFTQFHETAARRRYPIRCVQDKRFGYLFNPWSDGQRVFQNESQSGRTFAAMQDAAQADPAVAGRVDLFVHRVVEELYDFENDPDALHNLIDDPAYQHDLDRLRHDLEAWMVAHDDPALVAFRQRHNPAQLAAFMDAQESRSHQLVSEGNKPH